MSDTIRKKTICIDFDGVVHPYRDGWKGMENIYDKPAAGTFAVLAGYVKVFNVCIYSSRSSDIRGLVAMMNYFIDNGWPMDAEGKPADLTFSDKKPPAWLTIDDRCIRFEGVWPSIEEVDNFKPWIAEDD